MEGERVPDARGRLPRKQDASHDSFRSAGAEGEELWFVDYCWCGRRIECVLESGVGGKGEGGCLFEGKVGWWCLGARLRSKTVDGIALVCGSAI